MADDSLALSGLSYFSRPGDPIAAQSSLSQLQGQNIANQNNQIITKQNQLNLDKDTAANAALSKYRSLAAAGDPNAMQALAGYPEQQAAIYASLDKLSPEARASTEQVLLQYKTYAASVMSKPPGAARDQAYADVITKMEQAGEFSADKTKNHQIAEQARQVNVSTPDGEQFLQSIFDTHQTTVEYNNQSKIVAAENDTWWNDGLKAAGIDATNSNNLSSEDYNTRMSRATQFYWVFRFTATGNPKAADLIRQAPPEQVSQLAAQILGGGSADLPTLPPKKPDGPNGFQQAVSAVGGFFGGLLGGKPQNQPQSQLAAAPPPGAPGAAAAAPPAQPGPPAAPAPSAPVAAPPQAPQAPAPVGGSTFIPPSPAPAPTTPAPAPVPPPQAATPTPPAQPPAAPAAPAAPQAPPNPAASGVTGSGTGDDPYRIPMGPPAALASAYAALPSGSWYVDQNGVSGKKQ